MKIDPPKPKRGEVWLYHPGRTIGAELTKTRFGIIVSSNAVGILPVKLVVPVTTWDKNFEKNSWHVRIEPDARNGLKRTSAADVLQMKSLSLDRFDQFVGNVSATIMEEIVAAIAIVIEYQ